MRVSFVSAALGLISNQHSVPRNDRKLSRVNNNRYQKINAISAEISWKHVEIPLSESWKKVEPEVLKKDLPELIQMLHIAERPTVKEVIQKDI